jgi:hypothetical protein
VSKKFPAIPEPVPTLEDLYNTVVALKQAVETLTRQKNVRDSAVTWDDLLNVRPIPVVTPQQLPDQSDPV